VEALEVADKLKDLILKFRKINGNLDFDFKETKIKFDATQRGKL
jgi:exoribonuclease R